MQKKNRKCAEKVLIDILGYFKMQSTLDMSKSKGPSKTLRDIFTSTYQVCEIEENTNRTTNIPNEHVI